MDSLDNQTTGSFTDAEIESLLALLGRIREQF
jgi:hypothetical protein